MHILILRRDAGTARSADSDAPTNNSIRWCLGHSFSKPSEYQKLQLSGAHGIASVTGLRLTHSEISGAYELVAFDRSRSGMGKLEVSRPPNTGHGLKTQKDKKKV